MKLSNFMRNVTNDVSQNFVPLQQEVNCINDFISLQRLNKKAQVVFTIEGNLENKRIAPLLLMTFVENVFKYGISNQILRHRKIDLLFLDINMPDISGIDLVRSLQEKPLIIFTKAHKQFALEGFELDAVDYLLKPIQFDRFNDESDSLFMHAEYRLVKIPLNEIDFIGGLEDYNKIHLSNSYTSFINTWKKK